MTLNTQNDVVPITAKGCSVSERQAEICSSPMRQKNDQRVTPRVLGSVLGGRSVASEVQNSKVVRVLLIIS